MKKETKLPAAHFNGTVQAVHIRPITNGFIVDYDASSPGGYTNETIYFHGDSDNMCSITTGIESVCEWLKLNMYRQ